MSGRTTKQEQERISPNHVPTIFHFSVEVIYAMHTNNVEERGWAQRIYHLHYFSRMVGMMREGPPFLGSSGGLSRSSSRLSLRDKSKLPPVKYVRQSGEAEEREE